MRVIRLSRDEGKLDGQDKPFRRGWAEGVAGEGFFGNVEDSRKKKRLM